MKKFRILKFIGKTIRDMPIRRKLAISFLLLVIIPVVLIGSFSFYRSSELLKLKTEQYTKDILMETCNNIRIKLQDAEKLSFQIATSVEIQDVLKRSNRGFTDEKGFIDEFERLLAGKNIDLRLKGFVSSDTDISAIQIMSQSGDTYYVSPRGTPFDIPEKDKKILDEGNGSAVWLGADNDTQTVAVGRAINSLVVQERIGYVFIYLRESSIYNTYKKTELFKNGEFFIAGMDGKLVSHKDKNRLNSNIELPFIGWMLGQINENFLISKVNGKNYYITYRTIEGTMWRIISMIPAVEYEKEIIWLRNWTILICLICCMLALAISIALSDSISKPVRRLSAMMMKVGQGNFNVSSSYESKNEMGILSSHFNKMVVQVQQLIQEVYQEQLLKQKAELKSLRMQINPHFLYNTLESINWMARIKGVPEIGRMVKALGDLMRSSISGDDFVPVEEEIRNINNYLTIQKFRYGDRFEVFVDISLDITMLKIPKLILQPIVENAIVHGIENKIGSGKIEIKGFVEEGKVVVEVNDNGIGMDEGLTRSLFKEEGKTAQTDGHTHIGLNNVDRRIKMYYGQEYGLLIESSPGNGTRVRISLPVDTVVNED